MRISLRLILSLLVVVGLVTGFFSYLQVSIEERRLTDDLERRAILLTDGLKESVESILAGGNRKRLDALVTRFGNRERLSGVVVFGPEGQILAATEGLSEVARLWAPRIPGALLEKRSYGVHEKLNQRSIHLYLTPIGPGTAPQGLLALAHDTGYIRGHLRGVWRYNFFRVLALAVVIVLTTLMVVRWSITRPIARASTWLRRLRMGEEQDGPLPRGDILEPLAAEVGQLAKSLAAARAAAEKEASLRLSAETVWTPEKLKEHVRRRLGNKTLFLISNREPYMHQKQKRKIECVVPASGLVTALEPVMRACGGVWIAHGSGDADRESCDANGKLRVPAAEPAYTLKRVWISKEEEDGYYYGFSNEGLWPLCHITHTRPNFRLEDWIQYQKVNRKFADALLEEVADEPSPLVLIQDYHFALLPLLIKEKRPDARVALFWHIPWPNPESFGICPWKQEILLGMMGADIVGFHIQFHCNNFLDTVDNVLEAKVDWEHFSVERAGRKTLVRPFPISVPPPAAEPQAPAAASRSAARDALSKDYGLKAKYIGVGVDRLDYTKGILERFQAVERFFEKYPQYIGQFAFVQLGAPSRTHIQKYHDFIGEVEKAADRINWRFRGGDWKPILLLKAHHSHEQIQPFYRAADVCMVTSLHDGMNLVAKEFVSARADGDGTLILSPFTGASRELSEALIVNPYDAEALADALRQALEMPADERERRMRHMRAAVRERNVYRWAGNLIASIARLPARELSGSEAEHGAS